MANNRKITRGRTDKRQLITEQVLVVLPFITTKAGKVIHPEPKFDDKGNLIQGHSYMKKITRVIHHKGN